jgi:hypothetical protein
MKFATLIIPADWRNQRQISLRDIEAVGGYWVQLGRAVLVYAADSKWRALVEGIGEQARGAETPEGDVRKGDLHLPRPRVL